MTTSAPSRFTLADFRAARRTGRKVAMLTCYDFTTARLMERAGVRALLMGDSVANVVLGHPTTLPVPLDFMIELTAAVRRGAPSALLMADMPFGSYQASVAQGVKNVCRMVKLSGCDWVKLEVADSHAKLVRSLSDAGVAVVAHLGLRPQAVGQTGYRYQGRTADEAMKIVRLAQKMEAAGAAGLLLEAVPPAVGQAVVEATGIPVIGCGAGPACHASVFVTSDALGFADAPARFVPKLADVATPTAAAYGEYVRRVESGEYPAAEHDYPMDQSEQAELASRVGVKNVRPLATSRR
jgi:3-methyl-2-oxobutanoate hydroxymethyltransferase